MHAMFYKREIAAKGQEAEPYLGGKWEQRQKKIKAASKQGDSISNNHWSQQQQIRHNSETLHSYKYQQTKIKDTRTSLP